MTPEMQIAIKMDRALSELYNKNVVGSMNEMIAKFPNLKELTEDPTLVGSGLRKIIESQ